MVVMDITEFVRQEIVVVVLVQPGLYYVNAKKRLEINALYSLKQKVSKK